MRCTAGTRHAPVQLRCLTLRPPLPHQVSPCLHPHRHCLRARHRHLARRHPRHRHPSQLACRTPGGSACCCCATFHSANVCVSPHGLPCSYADTIPYLLLTCCCSAPYTGTPTGGTASASEGDTATADCYPGIIGSISSPYWGCRSLYNSSTIYATVASACLLRNNCTLKATAVELDGNPW